MNEATWERLQAALDRREDPLEDPEVVAALLAEPEQIERVAAWRAALAALPHARRARPWRWLAGTAALAAAGVLAWLAAVRMPAPTSVPAPRTALLELVCEWQDASGDCVRYERTAGGERWSARTAGAGIETEVVSWEGPRR